MDGDDAARGSRVLIHLSAFAVGLLGLVLAAGGFGIAVVFSSGLYEDQRISRGALSVALVVLSCTVKFVWSIERKPSPEVHTWLVPNAVTSDANETAFRS
jgi:hypothetical protein